MFFRIYNPKYFFLILSKGNVKSIRLQYLRFFYMYNDRRFGFYINISRKVSKSKVLKHFLNRTLDNYLIKSNLTLPTISLNVLLVNNEYLKLEKKLQKDLLITEFKKFLDRLY